MTKKRKVISKRFFFILLFIIFIITALTIIKQTYFPDLAVISVISTNNKTKIEKPSLSADMTEFRNISQNATNEIPLETAMNYYDKIGPENLIKIIEEDPYCHSKGHSVGKAIYLKTQNLNTSIEICSHKCTTGCFHGVLMGFFNSSHDLSLESIKNKITTICNDEADKKRIQKGVCIHGMGHALLYISDYDITTALEYCDLYPDIGSKYYCATGIYMEQDIVYGEQNLNVSPYYPCDTFSFPAACFRYKLYRLFNEDETDKAIIFCKQIQDEGLRNGCFHGLGFTYFASVETNPKFLHDLCSKGSEIENKMCIEGAIGVLSEFNPSNAQKACDYESGKLKTYCNEALQNKNFGLRKDFTNYYMLK